MFAVDWANLTHLAAFGVGFLVGVIVTIRLTKVVADERRHRDDG